MGACGPAWVHSTYLLEDLSEVGQEAIVSMELKVEKHLPQSMVRREGTSVPSYATGVPVCLSLHRCSSYL